MHVKLQELITCCDSVINCAAMYILHTEHSVVNVVEQINLFLRILQTCLFFLITDYGHLYCKQECYLLIKRTKQTYKTRLPSSFTVKFLTLTKLYCVLNHLTSS